MNQRIIQAYRQAPWRVQLQWIGLFLLILVAGMLIAGVYLYVSGRAAETGARIKALEVEREGLAIRIADMRTQLALLNSSQVMLERAEKLGFRPVEREDLVYLPAAGVSGREVVFLAPPPTSVMRENKLLRPAYTQSLWDLFYQTAYQYLNTRGGQGQ
ncbi:hypothetical protein BECAL_02574 [Bellilinea caldifistulae]|uniref:Cell division protein FtsL n=1 Tax=Bellilinea caldifistulae TaxID=360411 RepID=A0A0P6X0R6_9CHLR|nr:hypothetical protein [Bellilinea caldifistulae]KPL75839.1 hypothetical protein AC812_07620 [Bellilinea caldifistulae]GAP11386.1 hypothetical protein BECAL_02574 [Bellilinea caldifistulae]GIV64905.1 MAG: hypothetical protein KatS3mg046_165 [Bellilinea sp.]